MQPSGGWKLAHWNQRIGRTAERERMPRRSLRAANDARMTERSAGTRRTSRSGRAPCRRQRLRQLRRIEVVDSTASGCRASKRSANECGGDEMRRQHEIVSATSPAPAGCWSRVGPCAPMAALWPDSQNAAEHWPNQQQVLDPRMIAWAPGSEVSADPKVRRHHRHPRH